jgi:hypothetical protein
VRTACTHRRGSAEGDAPLARPRRPSSLLLLAEPEPRLRSALGLGPSLSSTFTRAHTHLPSPTPRPTSSPSPCPSRSPWPGEHCLRVLHAFWLELQRRRHEASQASLAPPAARVRAGRKSAPPRPAPTQAPTIRQQRSQDEVEEEPAATAPQAEAASNVPGADESSRSGDQYDGEYYY